jgi:hypothetical protein
VLVAAAVCPHPPLLAPAAMGLAGDQDLAENLAANLSQAGQDGVDEQIRRVRAACYQAVRELAAADPDLIVVVGAGNSTRSLPGSAAGSLQDFGVPLATGTGEPVLPLSLTIGCWLIRRCLADRPWQVELSEVAQSASAADCLLIGARLASRAPRVALLVMGDGSARKALGVPGAADPRAERHDEVVAAALAAGDVSGLAGLDPALSEEVLAAGRAAWQVLAGAAAGGAWRAQLRYAAAPLDVGYLVASWVR